jgi:hypothetical protein
LKWIKSKELESTETDKLNELDKQDREQIERLIKALNAAKPFSESKRFTVWISWHIGLLIVGLLVYVVAQFLSVV